MATRKSGTATAIRASRCRLHTAALESTVEHLPLTTVLAGHVDARTRDGARVWLDVRRRCAVHVAVRQLCMVVGVVERLAHPALLRL